NHEHAIKRQIDAADHDAPRKLARRNDVHIVAAPDVERALLKQESEADSEQNLPKDVCFDRHDRNAIQDEKEGRGDEPSDRSEWSPACADKVAVNRGQGRQSSQAKPDHGVTDEFEAFRSQEEALHHQTNECDSEGSGRTRKYT